MLWCVYIIDTYKEVYTSTSTKNTTIRPTLCNNVHVCNKTSLSSDTHREHVTRSQSRSWSWAQKRHGLSWFLSDYLESVLVYILHNTYMCSFCNFVKLLLVTKLYVLIILVSFFPKRESQGSNDVNEKTWQPIIESKLLREIQVWDLLEGKNLGKIMKIMEDADLGVHLNHSMVRSTHRETDKLCLQVGIPEWKKGTHDTYQYTSIHINIHINTYHASPKISQESSSSTELATQESWNLASESKRIGPTSQAPKENVTNHSRTTQSPGPKDHSPCHYLSL